MRLAHLSDLHLYPRGALKANDLLTRRFLGAINLHVFRAGAYSLEVAEAAVQAVAEAGVAHTVVTGDVSNLALPAEFALAQQVLRPVGWSPQKLTVIPGNHDYYTPKSFREDEFGRWFGYTLCGQQTCSFPVIKDLPDGVRLIALRSAQEVPAGCAFGRVGDEQMRKACQAIDEARKSGLIAVVILHHNLHRRGPLAEATGRLLDRKEVIRLLSAHRPALVLHGHDHSEHEMALDGGVRVIGCGSTSLVPRHGRRGQFNVYDISHDKILVEKWRIQKKSGKFAPEAR